MLSPDSAGNIDQDETLKRMIQRARRITSGALNHERDLLRKVANHHAEVTQEVNHQSAADIGSPPAELVRAMRSPIGRQQLVTTYIHGRKVKTVIEPLGTRRPDRELAVWKCLVQLVERHAA